MFIAVLTFFIRKASKSQDREYEDFWERENNAKLVRPVDLETIAYLNIPLDRFPIGQLKDDDVADMEKRLVALSKRPLLNLTGKTNTELRETYGSPNLEAMKAIGDDFDELTTLLVDYGQALFDAGMTDEAITVLEYSVYIKSDVSKSYTLLGECYSKKGQPRRIETLKEQIPQLKLIRQSVIMDHLDGLLEKMKSPDTDL